LEEFVQQEIFNPQWKAPGTLFYHFFPRLKIVKAFLPVQSFKHFQKTIYGGVVKRCSPLNGYVVFDGQVFITPFIEEAVNKL
jgi:hypothetical protein